MTWRPICVGEAQVWLLRSSTASVELGQLLIEEVAAGGRAAVGEGGVREQVRLLGAGEHVQHWGDLWPHTPADREEEYIALGVFYRSQVWALPGQVGKGSRPKGSAGKSWDFGLGRQGHTDTIPTFSQEE